MALGRVVQKFFVGAIETKSATSCKNYHKVLRLSEND